MRLRDVVLKHSLGRRVLHHLDSTYRVEVNQRACLELTRALEDRAYIGAGRSLLDRLAARGLVEDGPGDGLVERTGSDLVSIEVEPIGRCNLDCKHCFVDFSRARMSGTLFAAVLAGAVRLGAVELTFNGGEPLLHPSTLDWLAQARAHGLRTQLFTNATMIDDGLAATLARAQVARVTVSLDGFEAAHDALRGPRAFARTTAGIRALVKAGVSVFTTTVIHPGNEGEVTALRAFCLGDLGVAGVRLSTIAPLGRARTAPELQLPAARLPAIYAEETARQAPAVDASGLLGCRAGVDKLYVSARGHVHGCHLFEGVAPPLGELSEHTLDEIYAGTQRRGGLFRAFSAQRLTRCQACPALADCRGGCRARAWQLTGDPWGPDAVSCQKRGLPPPAFPA